ncbi:HAMP domain-containing protein [Thalassomonas viridans]|uniref:histidine kinase n=1 Tax=Thalassomonas viridans TaxID=137584 RepID=A0AAF0CA73_9GAMM|nr:ATP-binding protein [Thalassomonas viridans]WDE06000.1 HAMP domain-containing protein [Thalassomonas viridans]
MSFSIRSKLFATLLAATGGVVLCMYLVMQWSFDQGFLNYVDQQQKRLHLEFSEQLAGEWQKEQSWHYISSHHRYWFELIAVAWGVPMPENNHSGRHRFFDAGAEGRRPPGLPAFPPPNIGHALPYLLDENKSILHGPPIPVSELKLYPIVADDKTVGYLGQVKHQPRLDPLDLQFIRQQSDTFILVAVSMVMVSLLAGLPVASYLVKPINELTRGTLALIAGKYHTAIPVTSKDELGLLSANFNTLADTLKENEQARRQWVADISHELRTPLAVLKGEIEAIQDGVRQSSPQAIASLHGEVEHLNFLIRDLYELSMSDIGALNYQKQPLNPEVVLETTLAGFRNDFSRRGIDVSFDSGAGNALVLADADRLKQLFANLLKNSLRYTDSPGKLAIASNSDGKNLLLHFMDSAPGVSSDELEKIFERLYRVEASRNRKTGGAGLGLSICHNIVKAHGGTIRAKASAMGGLWLTIKIPLFNQAAGRKFNSVNVSKQE